MVENLFSLALLRGLERVLPLFTMPYIVAVVGTDKFGVIATVQSICCVFVTFVNFGLNTSAVREIAIDRNNQERLNRIVGGVYLIKACTLFLSGSVYFVLAYSLPILRSEARAMCFGFLICVNAVLLPVWYFQGVERMKFIAIIGFISNGMYVLMLLVFVRRKEDYANVLLLKSACYILGSLVGLSILFGKDRLRPKVRWSTVKEQVALGSSLFLNNIVNQCTWQFPVVFVSKTLGYGAAGVFAVAHRIVLVGKTTFLVLFQVVYPRLSIMYDKMRQQYYRAWARVTGLSALLGVLMYLGILAILVLAMRRMQSEELTQVFTLTKIYGTSFLLSPLVMSVSLLGLVVCGSHKVLAKSQIVAIIMVLFGYPIVKCFGLKWYAAYLAGTEGVILVVRLWLLNRVEVFGGRLKFGSKSTLV